MLESDWVPGLIVTGSEAQAREPEISSDASVQLWRCSDQHTASPAESYKSKGVESLPRTDEGHLKQDTKNIQVKIYCQPCRNSFKVFMLIW